MLFRGERKVSTTAKAMGEAFHRMPRSRIAPETGTHSPWVSRLLSGRGHEVIVAHARNVRLIGESRRKDDRLDARTLARLARIDPQLLSPVKHRSARAQADLTLIRARAGVVRARTALVNTVRSLAKSYGERLRSCNVRNMDPEKAEGLSPELQASLEPLLRKKILPIKRKTKNRLDSDWPSHGRLSRTLPHLHHFSGKPSERNGRDGRFITNHLENHDFRHADGSGAGNMPATKAPTRFEWARVLDALGATFHLPAQQLIRLESDVTG